MHAYARYIFNKTLDHYRKMKETQYEEELKLRKLHLPEGNKNQKNHTNNFYCKLVNFIYNPIETKDKDVYFKYNIYRRKFTFTTLYSVICKESGKLIIYIIEKKNRYNQKYFDIYLNYTFLILNTFFVKDIENIIDSYIEKDFNNIPTKGIFIGRIETNFLENTFTLSLQKSELLNHYCSCKNCKNNYKTKLYSAIQNPPKIEWKKIFKAEYRTDQWDLKNTSINLKQSRIKSHQIYFQKPKVKVDELDNIIIMKNKTPIWNDSVNAYVLNFGGRVTKASIKNTILLDNEEKMTAMFGKINNNIFALDVKHPFSLIQAISFAITCFAK